MMAWDEGRRTNDDSDDTTDIYDGGGALVIKCGVGMG